MRVIVSFAIVLVCLSFAGCSYVQQAKEPPEDLIYDPGLLKPQDSKLKVKAGDLAPDFSLQSTSGKEIMLSQFKGQKNVVISFIPAAWTPQCSKQWPGYNMVKDMFDDGDAVLLGISTDNLPSLHAWTREMGGVWFEVLSDFWPHGEVAKKYGVLRSDGVADRALFFVDKNGLVKSVLVVDINTVPSTASCAAGIAKLKEQ